MCDVFLILRAMLRSLSYRAILTSSLADDRTAIHSEKSRRLVIQVSLKVSHHRPPLPLILLLLSRPLRSTHLSRGITRLVHLHALRYLPKYHTARSDFGEWDFMSCTSSFPVGRSGPTRVAPPERQLEIRAGSGEGLSRNSGDFSLWTVRLTRR